MNRLLLLQFFPSTKASYPDSVVVPNLQQQPTSDPPQRGLESHSQRQYFFSGDSSRNFCFRIDDEDAFDGLFQGRRSRIPFEATWNAGTPVKDDENLPQGVACPVEDCTQDCYDDNFDFTVRMDETCSAGGGGGGDGGFSRRTAGVKLLKHCGVEMNGLQSGQGRTWILGRIHVLPKMRRDGSKVKRYVTDKN